MSFSDRIDISRCIERHLFVEQPRVDLFSPINLVKLNTEEILMICNPTTR